MSLGFILRRAKQGLDAGEAFVGFSGMRCELRFLLVASLTLLVGCVGGRGRRSTPTFTNVSFGSVWDDPERCREALARGPMVPKARYRLRVASWNLDGFPYRRVGGPAASRDADARWLACAVASMDADIVALQDLKQSSAAKGAAVELLTELESLTTVAWRLEVDTCADPQRPHLAFLYRTDRVLLSHPETYASLDERERTVRDRDRECPGGVALALGAYVKSLAGGADLHLINVLLTGGGSAEAIAERRKMWQQLGTVVGTRLALIADRDVVMLGDLRPVGCERCADGAPIDEATELAAALAAYVDPLELVPNSVACTSYAGRPAWNSTRFAFAKSMRERTGGRVEIAGVCSRTNCGELDPEAPIPAFIGLSRHCPAYADLLDQDQDEDLASALPARPTIGTVNRD